MSTLSICQCDVHNANKCDSALFLNKRLSDLTITFPSHNISFPAHRLMMAKKSAYFENLFYGSMAMNKKEWKVSDNDMEPKVFKIVLAHCYDLNLLEKDFEMILQIYKLADFYMIDSLKSQCWKQIRDIISEDSKDSKLDYQFIIDWSNEFGFNDIKNEVLKCLSTKLCESNDPHNSDDISDHSFLLNLTIETCKELFGISKCIYVSFKESWRNPKKPLCSELVMSIVESASLKGILVLQGCFSPEVVNKIVNAEFCLEVLNETISIKDELYFSLVDTFHSQALYECFKNLVIDIKSLNLHIPCNSMSPNDLAIWSSNTSRLYLSNVDDQNIEWAASTIISLKPSSLYFPRSSLSYNSFEALITLLIPTEVKLTQIDICSSNMRLKMGTDDTADDTADELVTWLQEIDKLGELYIGEVDEQIMGW